MRERKIEKNNSFSLKCIAILSFTNLDISAFGEKEKSVLLRGLKL